MTDQSMFIIYFLSRIVLLSTREPILTSYFSHFQLSIYLLLTFIILYFLTLG